MRRDERKSAIYPGLRQEAVFESHDIVEKLRLMHECDSVCRHPLDGLCCIMYLDSIQPSLFSNDRELELQLEIIPAVTLTWPGCPSLITTRMLQHHRPSRVRRRSSSLSAILSSPDHSRLIDGILSPIEDSNSVQSRPCRRALSVDKDKRAHKKQCNELVSAHESSL